MQNDRTLRQKECLKNWLQKSKMHGTVEAATGFGKTRVGIMAIALLGKKYPELKTIVVVPTQLLKEQWQDTLKSNALNADVKVINTVVKTKLDCDLLILDECHRYASDMFSHIFIAVTYRYILGLTATLERLDGKENIIKKFCPVCDTVDISECMDHGWVSDYTEYLVLLDVDDIDTYKAYNRDFTRAFEFFSYDYGLAMSCLGPKGRLQIKKLAEIMSGGKDVEEMKKLISLNAVNFIRMIQKRKTFVNNHPKKIEVAKRILEHYKHSKVITFSNNVKMANSIQNGQNVYTGKTSKAHGKYIIEEFNRQDEGVLNTVQKANEGMDIHGLSVAVILGLDSSSVKATQRRGRVIRWAPDKKAVIFNLVIADTAEVEWFYKSHRKCVYTTIGEEGLNDLLEDKEPKLYDKQIKRKALRI